LGDFASAFEATVLEKSYARWGPGKISLAIETYGVPF
jgi:hypothetical protein